MKKTWIILFVIIAAGALAGGIYYVVFDHSSDQEATEVQVEEFVTRGGATYYNEEEPEADYRLLGKWQNEENPHWYRVYYSDWEKEDYFWGKEWYEDEDVDETDLQWHGNGWFLWRLEDNTVTELAVTDGGLAVIPHIYTFSYLSSERMTYSEKRDRKVRNFHKVVQ